MEEVLKLLKEKNIEYKIIEHEEVHTIEDMEKIGLLDAGYVCKNLFVRNANGKEHYLIACHHDEKVDLNYVAEKIATTKLSFGSAERLEKYVNLENGYVSPFGVINDESKSVVFVFDEELKNKENVGFHPNTNKATVYLKFNDLKDIIKEHGNQVLFIRL